MVRDRIRTMLPPSWAIAVFAVFWMSAKCVETAFATHVRNSKLDSSVGILLVAMLVFAVWRALAHPVFNSGYTCWLATTPWSMPQPLPLCHPQLHGVDVLVLILLVGLTGESWDVMVMFFFAFTITYTLFAAVGLMFARTWSYAYLHLFGLGALVGSVGGRPVVILGLCIGMLVLARLGISRSLWAFPWNHSEATAKPASGGNRSEAEAVFKWPFSAMRADLDASSAARFQRSPHALMVSILLGYYFMVVARLLQAEFAGLIFAEATMIAVTLIAARTVVYLLGHSPQVLARLATRQYFVFSCDRIVVAPLCIAICAFGTTSVLYCFGLPGTFVVGATISASLYLAIVCPPTYDEWRLTSAVRLTRIS